jgi:hypothetical protein
MSKARRTRKRRVRRKANAVLRHGPSAKPRHTSKSGRTGSVHSVQLKSRKPTKPRDEWRIDEAVKDLANAIMLLHRAADSEPDLDRASVLRRAACEVSVIAERVRAG